MGCQLAAFIGIDGGLQAFFQNAHGLADLHTFLADVATLQGALGRLVAMRGTVESRERGGHTENVLYTTWGVLYTT